MDRIIAHCGLDCSGCPAYVATEANDRAALEQVAAQWREQFKSPEITADSIICDGCRGGNGRLAEYCSVCEIRACAVDRAVVNCAHCGDYGCEKLENFFAHAAEARQTLDAIRAAL